MKPGDKVVCIRTVNNGLGKTIYKGKIYSIYNTSKCCKLFIDIGIKVGIGNCFECGHVHQLGIAWADARLFRPLEYNTCHDELINVVEEKPDIMINEPVENAETR